MFTINRNPSRTDLRWFAAGMIIGIPAVAAFFSWRWPWRGDSAGYQAVDYVFAALAFVGVIIGVAALVAQGLGRKLYIAWMTITMPIGIAVSTVLLTLMYFVLLPVFSLIVRRKDPLRKKLGGSTYWEDYKPIEHSIERMHRPF